MKFRIKPYIISLIKENIIYVGTNLGLITILMVFLFFNLPKITLNKLKIDKVIKENKGYAKRLSILDSAESNIKDMQDYLIFLNRLIPNTEDYFSIIYALEKISRETGFLIKSYTIDMKHTNKNRLNLGISGTGDKDAFIKFLKTYNFSGGRLITADKFELSPQLSGSLKINVTFYSKKTAVDKNKPSDLVAVPLDELKKLRNKIEFKLGTASNEAQFNYSYPRKINPF